ncbi:MAG: Ig-like domain-containing protein [Clostridia bacterium]|nr:Ig-like domain-containing protein [Clostridia bacterium]
MRFTMKRTLALVLALMLAMPTFVLADGVAVAQDANGQITANEPVLNDSPVPDDSLLPDDDLLLDGNLVLDGLSLELPQPEDPSGDLALGPQDPAEGGAGEQPDAQEVGARGEPPLELGDDAQGIGDEIPVAQPLMPPDDVLEATMEVENVTDPAMAANDGEKTPWQQLAEDFQSKNAITLTADCIASESDTRLISATSGSFALNLGNNTINRNLNASKEEGNVIKTQVDMTVNGPGKITGGKTKGNNGGIYGGGIAVDGSSTLSLAGGVEITGNLADSAGSHGCGGGVYLRESDSATDKNRLIMNNSAILSNTAAGFGGGVYLEDYAELEMNNGAIISDNNAQEGGDVVVDKYASFNMKGGSITGNHANGTGYGYGGGISLRPDSTFTMENGQITGNHADFKGGGVYISDKSTFTMTGGTIEDNFADSADCNGGGVYVGGTFSIGGGSKISITGNTKNGDANNVYLPANKTITVNGTLSDDSIIGVTTANVPSSSNGYIPITNRFSKAYLSKNSVFMSDNANYEVGVINNTDTDKQLGLGLKIVHKAESVSVDYDGNDHSPKVNVTVPEGSDQTVVTYKGELPEKVGKYTVEYEVSNSATVTSKYCFPAKGKGTVTIRPVVRIEGWTYGGQPKTPTVESASLPQGATLAYEYFTDADCTKKTTSADGASSEGGAPRNAGTYYVRATATVNSNEIKSLAKSFTIKSASMKGSAEGYKGEYDGRAHGITVSVTTPSTGYTVKYGTTKDTYDKSSLTYTEAGNYTVYYQVTAKNYVTVTGSETVEITAKASDNLSITLSQAEYTYDGAAKKPTVTVKDKKTGQVVPEKEYKVTYANNVNAGTATVTLTDVAGGNYVVNGDKTFTINKAAMVVEAEGYKGEYDGKAHGITVNVTEPKTGYTVKYGAKEGTYDKKSLTYTDAGVYTVYYQVTAENYETVTGSAAVEITAKASDNLNITLSQTEYTYDGTAKKPTVTVTDKDTKQIVPASEYSVTYSDNVNAGTAKVTLTDAEGGNYAVKGIKTFTIKGAAMTIEVKGYNGEYDGEAHGITVNVIEPSTGYIIKYGTVEGTYDKDSLTYTDAGVYTVYYQVTAENYETVTGSATVEITTNKKTSMTVVAEDYKGEYDREAHGIKVTVTEPKTGYTVKYSTVDGTYDKDSLTYTDTGVYTVYYQVTAENYETVTGSAKVEITARIPTDLTIDLSAKTYYYYAKARKPTVTVKDGDTVVPENEYRVTYKNNIHAGTATVKITSFTKGNYSFAEERNFTIKPRNVHLKYTKLTFTYDGKYHLPLAKAIGVYPADENKYNVIMTGSGRNVGRYIARTTGIDNPDYHMLDVGEETRVIFYINPRGGRGSGSSGSGNARFVAEKKIGTEGIGTVTYDGKAQEPKFVVKCVFNDSNGVASNTVLTVPASEYKVTYSNNVDVGKATVKVTDVPGGNFIVDFSPEFTIAPRKATVTAKDQHVKTVDSVKTGVMAVKVKGLAKGHTLKSVKLDVDIKAGAKKGRIIPGRAKIVDAEGKDVTRNYKLDYAAGSLAVTAPKPDFTLLARMTVSGNSKMALKVAWTDVADACAYDVYFAKCGSEFRLKKTVKASKPRVVRFKGLDKRVSYKAYVKAWKMVNNQKVYIGNASPQVHAITGGYTSQECNTQSVKLNRTRLTLKAGGSASLKAKLKCVKSGKKLLDHADKVRWYSTDANVATVDANGKVTAVGKGSCTIYAIANNGVRSSAKVKVK